MMTNTKKAKERITDTFALLDCVGADVAIVNADTGETIKQAGAIYLRRKDSKHDEVAARVAAMHAEAEGREDA